MIDHRRSRRLLLPILVVCGLAACAPPAPPKPSAPPPVQPEGVRLHAVSFNDLAGWNSDDHGAALAAFRRSCKAFARLDPKADAGPDPRFGRVADWEIPCRAPAVLGVATEGEAQAFFESEFAPYRVTENGEAGGLITGYFEPVLHGAWRRGGKFHYPIYKPPHDLVSADLGNFNPDWKGRQLAGRVKGGRLVPYDDRAAIAAGSLAGRGLELMWLDDAVDAFFLHVQGSGLVRLTDGAIVRVGFAGRNGRPYTAIGRVLAKEGAIPPDRVSLAAIRAWLKANPGKAQAVMNVNRSYIFFRVLKTDPGGPIGAEGVALTAGRSIAVDRAHWPLGLPVWLETRDPRAPNRGLRGLVIAQDTGSAITGAIRADLFWGAGPKAAAAAGRMQEPGSFYVLLPRRVAAGG